MFSEHSANFACNWVLGSSSCLHGDAAALRHEYHEIGRKGEPALAQRSGERGRISCRRQKRTRHNSAAPTKRC